MAKEIIARYEIQSEIGRGGMAVVYLAYDPNFRRKVAIKLVAGNLEGNLLFRERFEREAQLIAKIEHPAIVPVYDYGEQDHDLYLVMRYMPGGPLAGKIKAGASTLREAAQIISQIAPALDAVHSQGIVHRDLKPGNILFDNFGNPAISDFGIAHFASATTDLTGSAIIGTPSYMSPEQVRGDTDLDGRSDIYALGVILFEMLTGHGPFQAKTPLSIAMQHLTNPVPSIRLFRPDLPVGVERILNKSMAKDREMRYSTASELALELRAISDTTPEGETPVRIPAGTISSDDAATEVDENSPLAFNVSSAPQIEVPQLSNNNGSEKPLVAKAIPQESISGPSRITTTAKRSSRGIWQVVAIAGAGLFGLFLCGSLGLLGTWARFGLPGLFPKQNQTALPTLTATLPALTATLPALTATQASNVQDIVLFSDDFSDPNSGWPTGQNAQGKYGYQSNGYHILVDGTNQVLWASTDRVYDNSSIYVDVTPVIAGANGYYGLLCRIQDEKNFYYFVIRRNGDYTIGKYKNAEFHSFFAEGWRKSDAVNMDNQTIRLQSDCVANTLRLTVNNVILGEATDMDFSSGFIGIVAATLDSRDFEVKFNNFLITKAGQ